MATLAQLKTRIILEVDRDDLGSGGEAEQALIDACTDAIEHYSGEEFWFNRASGSGDTLPIIDAALNVGSPGMPWVR